MHNHSLRSYCPTVPNVRKENRVQTAGTITKAPIKTLPIVRDSKYGCKLFSPDDPSISWRGKEQSFETPPIELTRNFGLPGRAAVTGRYDCPTFTNGPPIRFIYEEHTIQPICYTALLSFPTSGC
jgi:hypothetical protein